MSPTGEPERPAWWERAVWWALANWWAFPLAAAGGLLGWWLNSRGR